MSGAHIEQWQHRPQQAERPYFTPTPTTYYESVKDEKPSRFPVLAWIVPNAVVLSAQWAAHQACVHGNGHSVVATTVLGGAAGLSAALAGGGFASKKDLGLAAASVLAPTSFILIGFGVVLWSPTWPAACFAALMLGALNGGIWALRIVLHRRWRRMVHEAGLKHDEHSAELQKTEIVQTHETTRRAIGYQESVDVAYSLERRQAIQAQQLYQRHPDTFSPAVMVSPVAPMLLAGVSEALALAASELESDVAMSPAERASVQERLFTILAADESLTPNVRDFYAQQARQARELLAAQDGIKEVAPVDADDDLEKFMRLITGPTVEVYR